MRGDRRGRGGGDGHLIWIVLLVGVGLNSSGDPGNSSLLGVNVSGGTKLGGM